MDIINEYLNRTRKVETMYDGAMYECIRPYILCKDGFTISVQASEYHYCTPRINGAVKYETVELGFPNIEDSLIIDYAEEREKPTDTVYGYVPVRIVNELVEKHGGVIN